MCLVRPISVDWFERHNQFEFCSAAGAAVQFEFSAYGRESFFHIGQAIGSGLRGSEREPAAIVLNGDDATSGVHCDAEPDFGGGGMFGNIVQGFLHREEEVMPLLGGQRIRGKIGWQVKATANARRTEEVLRVFAEVAHEA